MTCVVNSVSGTVQIRCMMPFMTVGVVWSETSSYGEGSFTSEHRNVS